MVRSFREQIFDYYDTWWVCLGGRDPIARYQVGMTPKHRGSNIKQHASLSSPRYKHFWVLFSCLEIISLADDRNVILVREPITRNGSSEPRVSIKINKKILLCFPQLYSCELNRSRGVERERERDLIKSKRTRKHPVNFAENSFRNSFRGSQLLVKLIGRVKRRSFKRGKKRHYTFARWPAVVTGRHLGNRREIRFTMKTMRFLRAQLRR